jgi:2-polyprenyl-3-methyl-5-hydroxy-6-metoxy-1,4-benzoquinol methylase
MKPGNQPVTDPVAAYDQIAPFFDHLADKRAGYLRAIEALISARIPPGSRSLLDVGAGDGGRALRIAEQAQIAQVVLLEPSAGMRNRRTTGVEVWAIRAEELKTQNWQRDRRFDVITCLWNVLGHIPTASARASLFEQLAARLAPRGRIFLDVQHRYNARSYGGVKTAARFLHDQLLTKETSGDVTVSWPVANPCLTYGHVFTHRELRRLAEEAGLRILERVVVDYDDGYVRRFSFEGNLFYVFCRRSSDSAAARVAQTSLISSSVSR